MRYSCFEIENFKGIAKAKIDLDGHPKGNVYTLVGLNESGKTTVLQALHFFSRFRDDSLDALNIPGYSAGDIHDYIPMNKRMNFNGAICVKATCIPDADDSAKLRAYLKQESGFSLTKDLLPFEITHRYNFADSKVIEGNANRFWTISIVGRRKGAKHEKDVSVDDPNWQKAIGFIKNLLPSILYFPNFLFEFPDRIYLEDYPPDADKHRFYCGMLQDVLDDMKKGLKLRKHILERAQSGSRNDARALQSVLLEMGGNISATVVNKWNQIFKQRVGSKEVLVTHDVDDEERVYIQLKLRDGVEQFEISERSLGFRWFFAFLLLTHYRGSRKEDPGNTLFLLDEPASNLHPSAQRQLLESFGSFPSTSSIIYTTHSHHMINPIWLENTFVVKNEGLVYDSAQDDFTARKTVISLERYRVFAAKHPDQKTYFQPVLDVLDYCPSQLENVPAVVMIEGKNDFYTLHYFQDKVLKLEAGPHLLPGGGAGSLAEVIRLYVAWGRQFIVLLDSDPAGRKEKARYARLFGSLVEGRIFTLADIDPSWKNHSTEQLFAAAELEAWETSVFPQSGPYRFDKSSFNRAIQELYLTNRVLAVSKETKERFGCILDFLSAKLKDCT